jgi:hypothetical protein
MCSLCAGVRCAAPDSAYVLCLDDDAELHPSTITDLVAAVERPSSHAGDARAARGAAPRRAEDPMDGAFMATGYPFDVPAPGSGLFSYCVMAYHLPLIILFCLCGETANVWGGCMLVPLEALRSGSVGLLQACLPLLACSCRVFLIVVSCLLRWAPLDSASAGRPTCGSALDTPPRPACHTAALRACQLPYQWVASCPCAQSPLRFHSLASTCHMWVLCMIFGSPCPIFQDRRAMLGPGGGRHSLALSDARDANVCVSDFK